MTEFMQEAFTEAKKGVDAGHGGPFGAVLVKEGKIIARGHNEVIKTNNIKTIFFIFYPFYSR